MVKTTTKVVAKKKAVSKKVVSKPKVVKNWVCLVRHAGSGMVFSIHKFVSLEEYKQAYKILRPVVGEYWGCFTSLGEWPIQTLDQAKEMFDKVFGHLLDNVESYDEIVDIVNKNESVIEKQLKRAKNEMKRVHDYDDWELLLKNNKKKAAKLLSDWDITKDHLLSISSAFENFNDKWCTIFSTKEEKKAFELYLQEKLHWPEDEMYKFSSFIDTGVVSKVNLIEDIRKEVVANNGLFWA